MTIVRVAKRGSYTVVDNRPIDDPTISFQALGLLTYLLSKPDHWEVSYRHLATVKISAPPRRGEGTHAVRRALAELRDAGYLVQSKERGEGGTWQWVSTVYEVPVASALVGPCVGLRGSDSRGSEDRGEVTTERANPDLEVLPVPSALSEDGDPGFPRDPDTRLTRATVLTAGLGLAGVRAVLRGDLPAPDVDVAADERAAIERLTL